jgi:hypothetical protein
LPEVQRTRPMMPRCNKTWTFQSDLTDQVS